MSSHPMSRIGSMVVWKSLGFFANSLLNCLATKLEFCLAQSSLNIPNHFLLCAMSEDARERLSLYLEIAVCFLNDSLFNFHVHCTRAEDSLQFTVYTVRIAHTIVISTHPYHAVRMMPIHSLLPHTITSPPILAQDN